MADAVPRQERGPAESQLVRRLLYLGEGLIFGMILHGAAFLAVTLTPASVADPILILLIVYAVVTLTPVLLVREDGERTPLMQEWSEVRRWRWVAVAGLLVAGILAVVFARLWAWRWPVQTVLAMMSIVVLGALVRAAGMYLSSHGVDNGQRSNNERNEQ